MIEVKNLQKQYGKVKAVKDLSFSVPAGTVFAFLGANGAGKSTTIECITTVLKPTAGSIAVDGHDVLKDAAAVRETIGVVFQNSVLDPLLTVKENLLSRAGFYGMSRAKAESRVEELTKLVNLEEFLNRRYGKLSGGQRRRVDIARALIHQPKVLFLDEPTAGLDPQSREQIWNAIHELRLNDGLTVFLTTHYMEETERADQVCIIDKGLIVAEGTPASLRAKYSSSLLTVHANNKKELMTQIQRLGISSLQNSESDGVVIPVKDSIQARKLINTLSIDDFEFRHGTMDDVFLKVIDRTEEKL